MGKSFSFLVLNQQIPLAFTVAHIIDVQRFWVENLEKLQSLLVLCGRDVNKQMQPLDEVLHAENPYIRLFV